MEANGEGNGNPLQYSSWKIPWTEKPGRLSLCPHAVHGVAKSQTQLSDFHFTSKGQTVFLAILEISLYLLCMYEIS